MSSSIGKPDRPSEVTRTAAAPSRRVRARHGVDTSRVPPMMAGRGGLCDAAVVATMQPADLRDGDIGSVGGDGPGDRGVLRQSEVGAGVLVIRRTLSSRAQSPRSRKHANRQPAIERDRRPGPSTFAARRTAEFVRARGLTSSSAEQWNRTGASSFGWQKRIRKATRGSKARSRTVGHRVGRSRIRRILKAAGSSPVPQRPAPWQTFLKALLLKRDLPRRDSGRRGEFVSSGRPTGR